MIKINLSSNKKAVDISNLGGFDFTKLKIKPLLIVIVLIYLPDFVILPMWESERMTKEQDIQAVEAKVASLKRKITASQDMERQIKELQAQEENLGKKLAAVKQAISEKKNPSTLLLYIAKNIPDNLWILSLSIDDNQMMIKGEALDYTSIGNFINSLRSSVFITDANIVSTSSATREADKKRIESFEVKFTIGRFEQ